MNTASGELNWLKNGQLEVAFSVERGLRLEVFREPGGNNLLRESDDQCRGLKTWVMMPSDIMGVRDMLSEEAAEISCKDGKEMRMQTKQPNQWGLVLEWIVRLPESGSELHLVQRIHNRGSDPQYLGIWSIGAFSTGTVLRIPFDRSSSLGKDHPNQVAVFPYTELGDARIHTPREHLEVQVRKGEDTGSIKLGIVQREGRVQAVRGDKLFEMQSPFEPGALYPEGGMNVTVYATPATGESPFGEAELMGPLQLLEPGESMELPLVVRLRPVE